MNGVLSSAPFSVVVVSPFSFIVSVTRLCLGRLNKQGQEYDDSFKCSIYCVPPLQ